MVDSPPLIQMGEESNWTPTPPMSVWGVGEGGVHPELQLPLAGLDEVQGPVGLLFKGEERSRAKHHNSPLSPNHSCAATAAGHHHHHRAAPCRLPSRRHRRTTVEIYFNFFTE
jgi:hypothetical protein